MFAAWNTGDVESILALYHPDFHFVDPTTNRPVIGHDGLRRYAQVMFQAFPDAHFEVTDVVRDGDKEVANWHFSGTQHGPFMRRPGTGVRLDFRGIDWVEWEDDRVKRNITFYDTALILQRLGIG